jgi:ABC-type Fe3+/spermidine/putrescine transport system ATPase subunit
MGLVNLLPGRIERAVSDDALVSVAGSRPVRIALPAILESGTAVQVAIRPESLHLAPDGTRIEGAADGMLRGKVAELTFLGNLIDCQIVLDDGTRVRVQADSEAPLQVGQALRVAFDPHACTVFES